MASKPSTKPSIRERARAGNCPNCGKPVGRKSAKGPAPDFCHGGECKRALFNRHMAEGAAIIAFAKAWRVDRGQGEIAQASFSQLIEILDFFNAEDLRIGRPRADYVAAVKLTKGTRYFDRMREKGQPAKRPEPEPEVEHPFAEALRKIAQGHNDPRSLAEAMLQLNS